VTEVDRYVPAAGRAGLTRLYDPALALTMRERRWRPRLLDAVAAGLPHEGTVVDVGAGTGTFAIALAQARPDVLVIAVDGDPEALALGRRKPGAERVEWREGLAGSLVTDGGVAAGSADAVVMSLLLHHLTPAAKHAALTDARRALAARGRLHVADWGEPGDLLMKLAFTGLRLLDGFENTRAHADGELPGIIRAAGFGDVERHARLRTAWGRLELLRARP
jgi:ubiquinone/menaquinone biosynthesis C-methylase UbiE